MKVIKSTNGYEIKVDDEDFEYLNQWSWQAVEAKAGNRRARRQFRKDGKMKHVSMHRVIMKTKKGQIVDHINHDQLDNRKSNLRICTSRGNSMNKRKQSNNTSGFKGVVYQYNRYKINGKKIKHKRSKPWLAQIGAYGKNKFLGYYLTPEEAALAYDMAAYQLHGKFAHTNFGIKNGLFNLMPNKKGGDSIAC